MITAGTVLIIEDDSALRRSLAACLEDSGYAILEAGGGRQGLEIFEKEKPDVIITDLRMSDVDGFTVISRVKAMSPATSIIVVSGTGDANLIDEAISLGAREGLRKPISDLRQLEAAVSRAMKRPI